ncbi:RNA-directed DNA polymerase, eukaryota, partial [Tanacetum coccineum]
MPMEKVETDNSSPRLVDDVCIDITKQAVPKEDTNHVSASILAHISDGLVTSGLLNGPSEHELEKNDISSCGLSGVVMGSSTLTLRSRYQNDIGKKPSELLSLITILAMQNWKRDFVRQEKLSVVGIQETKMELIDQKLVHFLWSSGNLIGNSFSGVYGKWNEVDDMVCIVNIYGPQSDNEKEGLWNDLSDVMRVRHGIWILFGDFNAVRYSSE